MLVPNLEFYKAGVDISHLLKGSWPTDSQVPLDSILLCDPIGNVCHPSAKIYLTLNGSPREHPRCSQHAMSVSWVPCPAPFICIYAKKGGGDQSGGAKLCILMTRKMFSLCVPAWDTWLC